MRRVYGLILLFSLLVPVLWTPEGHAAQRTARRFGKKEAERKSYSLDDIMESPREYLEREVLFLCRFATTSNLFKNVNTRFNSTQHVNFAVWPDKAVLWEEAGRKNVLPTLYVAKNDPDTLEMLRTAKKYELLAVTGRVLNVYAGYPWIVITKIERIEKPSERLCEQVIEHMQSGHEALRAEAGGAAARHYEQALTLGLPCEFRAKAYEQLAHAYLLDNRLDLARDYLREAVELDRNDPILHLALADVTLRMGDAGEAIAHSTFALERSGKYPQAYGIMGEALSLLGDYAKAFSNLNTAAGTPGITPREKAMVNVRRARIYARSGREPDAARLYVALSEPGEVLAGDAAIHAEIGLFYERMFLMTGEARYLDSALAAFEESARLGRVNPAMYYNAAEVEFRRQRLDATDYARVLRLIEKVYQIEPDYAAARVLEGRILYAMGNVDEAEFRYQSVASRIGNDAMALLALAEAYIDLEQYDDASAAVERAQRLEPWNERVQALGEYLVDTSLIASVEPTAEAEHEVDFAPEGPVYEIIDEEEMVQEVFQADASADTPDDLDQWPPMEVNSDIARAEAAAIAEAILSAESGIGRQKVAEIIMEEPIMVVTEETDPEVKPVAVSTPLPESAPVRRRTVTPIPVVTIEKNGDGIYLTENDLAPTVVLTPDAPRTGDLRPPVGSEEGFLRPTADFTSPSATLIHPVTPEDFQTFGMPVQPDGDSGDWPPMTRVTLPPALNPAGDGSAEAGFLDEFFTLERLDEMDNEVGALNLGVQPGGVDMLMPLPRNDSEFDPDFGSDYDWDDAPVEPISRETFLRFGQAVGSDTAYAMLPVPENRPDRRPEGDMAKIPPPFSFSSDDSPVILASVMSPGAGEQAVRERNANVFRRPGDGKRRPAEITENEPVSPRLVLDASVMAPPAGGGVPRAEVRLPMSSRGLGMTDGRRSER